MTDSQFSTQSGSSTQNGARTKLDEGLEHVRDLPGFDRGDPQYYRDPMIDRLMDIVLALGAELWVTRDRQTVMEHLLATEGKVTPELIETFVPSPEMAANQVLARKDLASRLYGDLYGRLPQAMAAEFLAMGSQKNGY